MSAEAELDGPHWRFALDFYARPGVAGACLSLQDACGVDVNVLLVAIYAATRLGRVVGPDEIAALDAAAAPWRERAVLPLRRLRRDLKGGVAGAGAGDAETLRDGVKALELKAEQIEQSILADRLVALPPDARAPKVAETIDAVVGFYARGAVDESVRPAMSTVAAAAQAAADAS
ncbi:TIGR02444 family protein [Hansschlegelia zhihuaiae]|uniref:TIGR02444 family protein n=1 Tax=Hansschlegelia zhihuaiae TaxID=405005 RepID=UPI0013E8E335|nr:TIGR02444 family protein [Hansschlegelia zhihuaiae]